MASRPAEGATEVAIAAGFAGKLVAGRYKLESLIGAGAVGEVWLAEHIHMRKRYALKLVDKRYATPEIIARFEREAQAAANVSHQGIAHATDFGRDEDGSFFLVLEYVQGKSLRAALKEAAPFPAARALDLAKQMLSALGAAHKKGVIHRDLKPENLMLAESRENCDQIKILDFGIAKVDAPGEQLTRAGTVYGTPAYMSPEQALGKEVDQRTDLWAVGAILYEMLTGVPPFPGENLEVLAHVVNSDVAPPSTKVAEATPEIDELVLSLLQKERENRPSDVAAALVAVARAERSLRKPADASGPVPKVVPETKSKRVLLIAGGGLLLLIVLPLVLLFGRSKPSEEEPTATKKKPGIESTATASAADIVSSSDTTPSPAVSASATPSVSASASASASAPVATKPKAPGKKKEEKGFGKLKSLFK